MYKGIWILGLTGGVASGKTTASNFFKELGCYIIDADIIARNLVKPGTPALSEIANFFGSEFITENGELNRKKMRDTIFTDPDAKQFLDNLMHPLIREATLDEMDKCVALNDKNIPYMVFSTPLLFENHLEGMVDRILCMKTTTEKQIERTMERDHCSKEIALGIINSQMPQEQKISLSNDVLESNMPTPEDLFQKVQELHSKYLKIISEKQ